jgi:hypothetical protein
MRVVPLLLLTLTGPPVASAQDFAVALDYDACFGPLRLLSMALTSEVVGDRYHARSVMQTEGLIAFFFPWRAESESSGLRAGTVLRPRLHRADGTYRSERRTVRIEYAPDGAVQARVAPPPEDDWRDGVPQALQDATIDPLTASLLAVGEACRGRLPVFDGRRRYDLRLEELPHDLVPARGGIYAGPARRCRAFVEAQAGFWRSDPRDSEEPTYLDLWIASPRADVPTVPVYLELTGARGTIAVILTRARPLAPGTSPAS